MEKGLSPIVAVILILLISISLTVLAMIWLPKFEYKIFPVAEKEFNRSYVRSQGCLSIEDIDPYEGIFTLKNCGKTALRDFKLFIDLNQVTIPFIEKIDPYESATVEYKKCLTKEESFDFYVTADLAETPVVKVNLPIPIVELSSTYSIADRGDVYYCLGDDMISPPSLIGINFTPGSNDAVLDCSGYNITRDGASNSYGIYLNGNHNVTVKNCNIANFQYGVYLTGSADENTFINITSYSNVYGFYFSDSSDNKIINSSLFDNSDYDTYVLATSDYRCNNELIDVNGTENKPIFYYNGSAVTIDGWNNNVSQIILCNADGSSISNVSLFRTGVENNGILFMRTDNSNIKNVSLSHYDYAFYLYNSGNNNLTNITAYSGIRGVWINYYSDRNYLDNVISNQNSERGIQIESSDNNRILNSRLNNNGYFDFYNIPSNDYDCRNEVTNVNGTDDVPIFYYNGSAVTIDGWNNNVSEIILCDADYSIIKNTVLNRVAQEINGIILLRTTFSNLTNISLTNLEYSILLRNSSNNNITNATIKYGSKGIYLYQGSASNSIKNSIIESNSNGIEIYYSGVNYFGGPFINSNNNITGGSIRSNTNADFYFYGLGATNNFTNTNFTGSIKIYLDHSYGTSWFNYNNETAGNIWLKTTTDYDATLTRKLTNWNRTLIQWNDSSNSWANGIYKITGLLPNLYYNIYDNSVLAYTLNSGPYGEITFSVTLPSNEHEIKVSSFCDYHLFSSDLSSTYVISQSNKRYCLVENASINNQNAFNFSSGVQNSTLDCLAYNNIDGNDAVNSYGVYMLGSNTKNNTIKNCNITDFDRGIYFNNGPSNNTLDNNIISSGLYGLWFYSNYNNTIINGSIKDNTNYDYYLNLIGSTTNFIGTDFTSPRKIYFNDVNSWFNYNNYTPSQIIFGKANVGANFGELLANYIRGSIFTLPEIGIIKNITIYSYSPMGGLYKCAIYDDNYGQPGNLKATTEEKNEYGHGWLWDTFNFPSPILLSKGNYWLACWGNSNLYYYFDNGGDFSYKSQTYGSFPSVYGSETGSYARNMSIFASYNVPEVWLKTSVSASTTLTRKIINWNQDLIKWNDTSTSAVTVNYNVTGLVPNVLYDIYDKQTFVQRINSGQLGAISFTINLPVNDGHEIKVVSVCDYFIFSSSIPYTITDSNKLYCLALGISNSAASKAITFADNVQNSTLDCLNNTIDGVGTRDSYAIYANKNYNATSKNCNLTEWGYGVYYNNSDKGLIQNMKIGLPYSYSWYGFGLYNSSDNRLINTTSMTWPWFYGDRIESGSNSNQLININSSSGYYGILFGGDCVNNVISNSTSITAHERGLTFGPPISGSYCKLKLENFNGTGNKPILFFNSSVNLQNWNNNFSEMILCNADNSVLNNIKFSSSLSNTSSIIVFHTDYSNFTNIETNNSYRGLELRYSNHYNIITNVTSTYNVYGFFVESSYHNIFDNITSSYNYNYGMAMYYDTNVTIKNSKITNNPQGIFAQYSDHLNFLKINSSENAYGIQIWYSTYNNVSNLTAIKNAECGVEIGGSDSSHHNLVENSNISLNNYVGLCIGGFNNTIQNNTIKNVGTYGISVDGANHTIVSNIIQSSGYVGIGVNAYHPTTGTKIYNNLMNNTLNFMFNVDVYNNFWNTTKETGSRIYSPGTNIGGNYWTNPSKNGYSDTCTDIDHDGFCDNPYTLTSNNIDYLPLSGNYSP